MQSFLAISETIAILSLLVMVPVYVMYFTALHYFGRALVKEHPDIHARITGRDSFGLASSYTALQKLQKDKELLVGLTPTVQEQYQSARRYLLIGTFSFMACLFAFLVSSVISKA